MFTKRSLERKNKLLEIKSISDVRYIYTLSCPITYQVRYVGQTNNLCRRLAKHIYDSKRPKSHSQCWVNGLVSNGMKPIMEELEECTSVNVDSVEVFYIGIFRSWGFDLTNLDGGGSSNKSVSKATKDKMSLSKISNWRDAEFRSRQTEIFRKKVFSDKVLEVWRNQASLTIHSEKSREKALVSIKKAWNTDKLKKLKSLQSKEMWNSISNEEKLRRVNKLKSNEKLRLLNQASVVLTEQYKQNVSESVRAVRAKEFSGFNKRTNALIGTWLNQVQCSIDLKIQVSGINACLNKRAKSCRGYTFEFSHSNG